MSAQILSSDILRHFVSITGFLVLGSEVVNIGAGDALPTRTSLDGRALTPIGLYVGTSGDVHVTLLDGSDVVFPTVPAGWAPIAATKVHQSGTGAAGMLFLYGATPYV